MTDQSDVQAPMAKVCITWVCVLLAKLGIHQWSDVAAIAATIYSLILIGEWCWKKFARDWWNALWS